MDEHIQLLAEGNYDEMQRVRMKSIPSKLYKFFPLFDSQLSVENEKRFKTLSSNSMWCSMPCCQNDPYEFNGFYINHKALAENGWPDDIIDRIEKGLDRTSEYYLCSLTANDENSLPMWAYYTNSYKGYCMEYCVTSPARIHPVRYESQRVDAALIVAELIRAHEEGNEKVARKFLHILYEYFYIKHTSWKHEKEYRIVSVVDDLEIKGKNISNDMLGIRPIRLIAGYCCSKENKARLAQICMKSDIQFCQATLSNNSYYFEVK